MWREKGRREITATGAGHGDRGGLRAVGEAAEGEERAGGDEPERRLVWREKGSTEKREKEWAPRQLYYRVFFLR